MAYLVFHNKFQKTFAGMPYLFALLVAMLHIVFFHRIKDFIF